MHIDIISQILTEKHRKYFYQDWEKPENAGMHNVIVGIFFFFFRNRLVF
jgi:hypothetical protein